MEYEKLIAEADALYLRIRRVIRSGLGGTTYYCGACDRQISRAMNYCPYCGKKVNWDG